MSVPDVPFAVASSVVRTCAWRSCVRVWELVYVMRMRRKKVPPRPGGKKVKEDETKKQAILLEQEDLIIRR